MNTENIIDGNKSVNEAEQARTILTQELMDREKRCSQEIQAILEREGFKLNIKQNIVLEPTR